MPPRARCLALRLRDAAPSRRARVAMLAAHLACAGLACAALTWTIVASGCASTRGALPALVIGGALTRSASARTATDATAETRAAWTARAELSLVWLPTSHAAMSSPATPEAAITAPSRTARRRRDDAAPCVSEALCAWERLARARALERLNPETPTP